MTWTLVFQIGFLAVLAMLVAVFLMGLWKAISDTRHKHAVEMEMAKHGHRVEVGAIVVNSQDEERIAKTADAALTRARQERGL